jgi:rubrerythrin
MQGTKQTLQDGFSFEGQAYQRYILFARQARGEVVGASSDQLAALLMETAALFGRTAEDEAGHADAYLRALNGIGDVMQNLSEAIEREKIDVFRYTTAAGVARAEGKEEIAIVFEQISADEQRHLAAFQELIQRLKKAGLISDGGE